jgi:hypothetical protein
MGTTKKICTYVIFIKEINFRRRRIELDHFLLGSDPEKSNPDNPENPVSLKIK